MVLEKTKHTLLQGTQNHGRKRATFLQSTDILGKNFSGQHWNMYIYTYNIPRPPPSMVLYTLLREIKMSPALCHTQVA